MGEWALLPHGTVWPVTVLWAWAGQGRAGMGGMATVASRERREAVFWEGEGGAQGADANAAAWGGWPRA